MQASVRLEHNLISVEGDHEVHAMFELSVPEPPDTAERPPLRLALVLDRSGSMAGDKLEVAKRCAAWLAGRLRERDELALVAYDDEVRLLAPLAGAHEGRLAHAIASIWPGGSTNLSGGWLKGLEQLRQAPADGPRKILLLTDGLANVGIVDPEQLVGITRGASGDGIGTSTIGFGTDFDEDLLTAMADAGGGNAHYAETPDAAPAIFGEELEGLTSLVAQNVTLEIRPRPEVEMLGVLNDYPQVAVQDGVQIQLGDAYGGERRRIVFELHIPHLVELGVTPIADLVLRYVSVGDEITEHTVTVPLAANLVSAADAKSAEADLEVREEVLVLKAAQARRQAIDLADVGQYEQAQTVLLDRVNDLRAAGLSDEADDLGRLAPSVSPAMYTASGAARKNLSYQAHRAQRRRR